MRAEEGECALGEGGGGGEVGGGKEEGGEKVVDVRGRFGRPNVTLIFFLFSGLLEREREKEESYLI